MSSVDQAVETQLNHIQAKTGKTLAELSALVQSSGLSKHGEIRAMLISELGLGYGDANALAHYARKLDSEQVAAGKPGVDVLDEIYSGPRASLRPIHAALMALIEPLGSFEIAPKKGYVSLRRKRQFAMIGPATNTRVELGLNLKSAPASERLLEQPAGSMCSYKVRLSDASEVDAMLAGWIKQAYESAG